MARQKKVGNPSVAVAYLRVSTDDQALGVESQRTAIQRWAEAQSVTVAAWYSESVSGAAPVDKRLELLGALGALREHGAGILVVARRDRLARDVVAAAMLDGLAARSGARIVSAAGEGSSESDNDPGAMLMRRLVDAFAEYERALIRSRTRAALAVKRAQGYRTGECPFGYEPGPDGKLRPHAGEQAIIGQVKDLRATGLSVRAIADELRTAGVTSARAGKPLGHIQVWRMLRALDATQRGERATGQA